MQVVIGCINTYYKIGNILPVYAAKQGMSELKQLFICYSSIIPNLYVYGLLLYFLQKLLSRKISL